MNTVTALQAKIGFMYARQVWRYGPSAPSQAKMGGENASPNQASRAETSTPKPSICTAMSPACSRLPEPRAAPISAVAPVAMPLESEVMMKKTGMERESAATAWVSMRAAHRVSTTLNRVWKKNPTEAGTATWRMTSGTGRRVRSVVSVMSALLRPAVCPTPARKYSGESLPGRVSI